MENEDRVIGCSIFFYVLKNYRFKEMKEPCDITFAISALSSRKLNINAVHLFVTSNYVVA